MKLIVALLAAALLGFFAGRENRTVTPRSHETVLCIGPHRSMAEGAQDPEPLNQCRTFSLSSAADVLSKYLVDLDALAKQKNVSAVALKFEFVCSKKEIDTVKITLDFMKSYSPVEQFSK